MQRQCIQCGNEFKVDKPERKYCSWNCYDKARTGKLRPQTRRRINVPCVVCGTVFETGGRAGDKNKQYCSWECRYLARFREGYTSKELTPLHAAYIAGIVDGEGSIMAVRHRDVVAIRVTVSNTNREIIEWLIEVTGLGSAVAHGRQTEKHKQGWFWECFATSAESFLKQIEPYLRIKKRQAQLALDTLGKLRIPALKADRSWQMAIVDEMKAMNKRGPVSA